LHQNTVNCPPRTLHELKNLIAKRRIVFPERLECVAREVLKEPEIVAFGSAAMIARKCKVSETTVLRLPKHFGLLTFADLKRLFQEHLRDVKSRGSPASDRQPAAKILLNCKANLQGHS
jgi:DNA-binding MurR/RpiR family transcriptional regulator